MGLLSAVRRKVSNGVIRSGRFLAQTGFDLAGTGIRPDHEGATLGRRLGMWGLSSTGPNMSAMANRTTLIYRSRELVRNNCWAKGGVNTLVGNLVGNGIQPSWHVPGQPDLSRELRQRFDVWTRECDADGVADFYGQTAQLARCVVESGEALARFRNRFASDGLSVPLQLQLLEPDFLDETRNAILPNGNYVRYGVEFDARIGKRTAYWLWPYHPGDTNMPLSAYRGSFGQFISSPVPADQVLHVGLSERIGEVRHLPWLSALILELYDTDGLEDAYHLRQKISNLLVGFRYEDGQRLGPVTDPGDGGLPEMELEPATMQNVSPGTTKIEWSNPPEPSANLPAYLQYHLRKIAKGLMLTYEQLSGDYSQANFSAARLAMQEFRRWAEMVQYNVFVFQWCQPVAERWLEIGVATGSLPVKPSAFKASRSDFTRITWTTPAWGYIEPVKEAQADLIRVRGGFMSRSGVITERGGDPEAVRRQIEDDNQQDDAAGIIVDSDPRKVSKTGVEQPAPTGDAPFGAAGDGSAGQ